MKLVARRILQVLVATGTIWRVSGDQPSYHFRMVSSPHNTHYAVQVLTGWSSQAEDATSEPTLEGRFQVFAVSSGNLLWQSTQFLADSSFSILLSDDGNKIVLINPRITDQVGTTGAGADVVQFYEKGHRIIGYGLAELGFDRDVVQPTKNNYWCFVEPDIRNSWGWDYPIPQRIGGNPIFAGNVFALEMLNKKAAIFSMADAKLMGVISLRGDTNIVRQSLIELAPELAP